MRRVRQQGGKLYVTSGTAEVVAQWKQVPSNGHDELEVEVKIKGTLEDFEDAMSVVRQMMLGEEKKEGR